MEHSKIFNTVLKYYNTHMPDGSRMWDENRVKNMVEKEKITAEEYEKIVGTPYTEAVMRTEKTSRKTLLNTGFC